LLAAGAAHRTGRGFAPGRGDVFAAVLAVITTGTAGGTLSMGSQCGIALRLFESAGLF